jgi:hypothetical protein
MSTNVPGTVLGAVLLSFALVNVGCEDGSPLKPTPGATPPTAPASPPPFVRSVVPTSVPTVVPTLVAIHGERFDAGATVTIGGARADVLRITATAVDVMTPAHAAGVVDVIVTNPDGQRGLLTGQFAFEDAPATVPSVKTISPIRGVTTGGTSVEISGTGFDARTFVSVDGIPVRTHLTPSGRLEFMTLAHDPGTVAVAVTNAAGSAKEPAGFTYARPDDFNFNGTWTGFADGPPETLIAMSFTIANDVLVSVSCGAATLTPTREFRVRTGEFSFEGEGGIRLTGRVLSDETATGEIQVPPCSPGWYANKQ